MKFFELKYLSKIQVSMLWAFGIFPIKSMKNTLFNLKEISIQLSKRVLGLQD